MSNSVRITLAQLDPTVGDIDGAVAKAEAAWRQARDDGAALIAFPEMFLTGYQPQDLILKPSFVAAAEAAAAELARRCADGPAILAGAPARVDGALYNAAWVLENGRVRARFLKHHLPNYGVFDEHRLFEVGPAPGPLEIAGIRVGAPICEDAWFPDVCETLAESGAELLLVINGSPYDRTKFDAERMPLMVSRVIETGLPMLYLNLVGGQDDQMFDGGSFALNPGGGLARLAPFFEETLLHVDLERGAEGWRVREGERAVVPDHWEADYRAMVGTTRAYVRKNGFREVLLGLSGGVDSALTATIAVDALGPENVRCVMLPSRFTSEESLEDAAETARRLGCRLDTLSIASAVETAEAALAPQFEGFQRDLTEENLQSRLRGLYLMALSNKTGALLLTTGNKSEMAVGYATLYGDMCGAYNPLKDLYKTRVFETCRWRNAHHGSWMLGPDGAVIPERVIDKPPSAELRADQKDEDSLPPYEVLDQILEALIEREESIARIVAEGFEVTVVRRVEALLYNSEYKRRQAAPGTKLTTKALWLDRRYPLTNRWRDRG